MECTCKDGKVDGLYKRWYDNGQLLDECFYKDAKKCGLYRKWNESGRIEGEYTYKDGVVIINLNKFCIDVNEHTKYSANIKDDVCCICLDNLEENVCKLSCEHMYHLNCIETYVNNNDGPKLNCCLCKQSIIIDRNCL